MIRANEVNEAQNNLLLMKVTFSLVMNTTDSKFS